MIDWTDLRVWAAMFAIAQFVIGFLFWVGRKSFATTENLLAVNKLLQDQIDDGEKKITSAHHKIELLELKMKGLPDFEDIGRMRDAVGALSNTVSTLAAEVKGIDQKVDRTSSVVDRIESHLLRQAA